MKFLAVFALVAVAAAQPVDLQNERFNIIGAILNALKPRPPISVGPAIVEGSPIHVGPAIVEDHFSPPHVEPALLEEAKPNNPYPFELTSPLVQVIVNVNSAAPALVEEIVPTPVEIVEMPVVPEEIVVAPIEFPEIKPEPVIVAPIELPEVQPEPVIIAPIEVAPVNLPDQLN